MGCSVRLGVGWRLADVGQRRVGVEVDGEVTDRHDTDELAVIEHGDTPDRLLAHEANGVIDGVAERQRGEILAADFAELGGGRILAVGDRTDGCLLYTSPSPRDS